MHLEAKDEKDDSRETTDVWVHPLWYWVSALTAAFHGLVWRWRDKPYMCLSGGCLSRKTWQDKRGDGGVEPGAAGESDRWVKTDLKRLDYWWSPTGAKNTTQHWPENKHQIQRSLLWAGSRFICWTLKWFEAFTSHYLLFGGQILSIPDELSNICSVHSRTFPDRAWIEQSQDVSM